MVELLGSAFCATEGEVVLTLLSVELSLVPAVVLVASDDWPSALVYKVCMYLGIKIELRFGEIRNSCSVKFN